MYDDEGLKDREDALDYLRFLLRYEDKLIDGWLQESDFLEEVYSTVIQLAETLKGDE